MLVGRDIVSSTTFNEIDKILGTEILLDSHNRLKYALEFLGSLKLLLRMQAIVTIMAILLRICLAEIVQKQFSTA
jgi:hypothetical protein